MSAAITDLLAQVGSPGTITSLAAPGKAIAASSINIGSATNWPTATAVYFAIRRVDPTTVSTTNPSGLISGTYTEWKGTVSGTVISNLSLVSGTDQIYPAGTNTQVLITIIAARENAIVTWGTTEHTQLGHHTGITTDTITTTGNATVGGTITATGAATLNGGTVLPNNDIQANELATTAITLGYVEYGTADFKVASGSWTDVTSMSVTATVPAGGRRVEISTNIPGLTADAGNATEVRIAYDGTQLNKTRGQNPTGQINPIGCPTASHVPSAGSHTWKVQIKNDVAANNAGISIATDGKISMLVKIV